MKDAFVIGVDFGTDSVRSVLTDARSGEEISSSVFQYPRWRDGLFCNPAINQFRQHPADYIEGLEATIRDCLQKAGQEISLQVKAISVDTTGSTPVAIDRTGTPLALLPGFENNPNAMFVLWKDHTATKEASEINATALKFTINYLQFVGGVYSSEWFWAKLLHILREDEAVSKSCYSYVEHCDWVPFLLTGGKESQSIKRGVCSAGHKALWAEQFQGLPPNDFFSSIDPLLDGFVSRLFTQTYTADKSAGTISAVWAAKLGLPTNVIIGIGAFDAHMGAVGGEIEPYHLSKVMGTSTCDMLVAPLHEMEGKLVKGICGQVPGSIIPGMMGMEAGQSAFGDVYSWFRNILNWPIDRFITDKKIKDEVYNNIITVLSEEASLLPLHFDDELAVDWLNGRRTPDSNQLVKASITNIDLATQAPTLFKALVESTCFGAKAIVDRFNEQGIPIKGLIGLGGVARKSPYIMQVMANVMNMPIRIHKSEQSCAAGAAMFAATASGIYEKIEDAMKSMGQGFAITFYPHTATISFYKDRYEKYKQLGVYTETNLR